MIRSGFMLPARAAVYRPPADHAVLRERPVQWSLVVSVLLHLALILLVTFKDIDPRDLPHELEVVLVNARSDERPVDPMKRAQVNQNGGGNTDDDRSMKSPLASQNDELAAEASAAEQRVARLEGEARALMARIQAEQALQQRALGVAPANPATATSATPPAVTVPVPEPQPRDTHGTEAQGEGTAFAREAAEIARNQDAYQKRPRRKQLGVRTVAYVFARYEDDYRTRVERIGTLNYPAPHNGQPVYGKVRLTVSVRANGAIEKIALERSSGDAYLDQQAINIVRLAAPFGRFTAEMLKEADVLDITRTFTFTRLSDGVHAE